MEAAAVSSVEEDVDRVVKFSVMGPRGIGDAETGFFDGGFAFLRGC